MTRIVLALVFTGLCSCATATRYQQLLKSWVGADVEQLEKSWGSPDRTLQNSDGNTVLVYERGGQQEPASMILSMVAIDADGNPDYGKTGYASGSRQSVVWCHTFIEVSAEQRIVGTRVEGNSCVSP